MNQEMLPKFKYNPNAYKNGGIEFRNEICQCCGKSADAFATNIYSAETIENVCVRCIANGNAAKKFHGSFVQDADYIDNEAATDELFHRTPGYISWQGENWVACCNDYCEYISTVGTEELEELGIADEIFEDDGSFDGYDDARDYLEKDGSLCGYLFRCLHCGKYHLRVDAD